MNCKYCKAICSAHGIDKEKEFCKGYDEITNADYIRSRSNRGLAEFLREIVLKEVENYELHGIKPRCSRAWEEWLSKGVTEGTVCKNYVPRKEEI